jgi:hypothetical protein
MYSLICKTTVWKPALSIDAECDTVLLASCSTYSSILKMEAICSSETWVDFQRTTRCYITEDRTLDTILVVGHTQANDRIMSLTFVHQPRNREASSHITFHKQNFKFERSLYKIHWSDRENPAQNMYSHYTYTADSYSLKKKDGDKK